MVVSIISHFISRFFIFSLLLILLKKFIIKFFTRCLFLSLNFYFSLPYFIEIVNINANKKNALEIVASKFNINKEEIIAIGDNFNDMDMINYAGETRKKLKFYLFIDTVGKFVFT